MLQSHICVSPRLPPSPPPLPSLLPKEEIVPGKHGARLEPAPRGPRGSTLGGGTSSTGWGWPRYGPGGPRAPSAAPWRTGRVQTVPASRSRGASWMPAILGLFRAKIHGEEKRLRRLRLTGQEASPSQNSRHTPPCSLAGAHAALAAPARPRCAQTQLPMIPTALSSQSHPRAGTPQPICQPAAGSPSPPAQGLSNPPSAFSECHPTAEPSSLSVTPKPRPPAHLSPHNRDPQLTCHPMAEPSCLPLIPQQGPLAYLPPYRRVP